MTRTLRKAVRAVLALYIGALLIAVAPAGAQTAQPPQAAAPEPPVASWRWRAELTRAAQGQWGPDAPVAVIAAQIHAESNWRTEAVSRVGAQGMAQFMPATARWWCALIGQEPLQCQPRNPVWAMRALVGYDKWLFDRVRAGSEYDRWWAALRAYNGGLGHWQAEARRAGSTQRQAVDAACGSASRSRVHCAENLAYPQRILVALQPLYLAWGRGVA